VRKYGQLSTVPADPGNVEALLPRNASGLGRRVYLCLALAGLSLYSVHALGGLTSGWHRIFEVWLPDAMLVLAVVALAVRVARVREERAAWSALLIGIACWAAGDIAFDFVYGGDPPVPSASDAFYLAFYPACYVALVLLYRSRISHVSRSLWLDGLTASLAGCAIGAAVLVEAVVETTQGSLVVVATNIAYPLGDCLLLTLAAAMLVIGRRRAGRTWILIGAGLLVTAIADGIYLFLSATGTYSEGTMLDALWPAAMLLLAWAGLEDRPRMARLELEGKPMLGTSLVCGLVAIGVFVADHFHRLNPFAAVAASLTLALVAARAVLTFRENGHIVERMSAQAVTDALTGLRNRRGLMSDLEHATAVSSPDAPHFFALFDLNGFKHYNDTFGHPAGDALLTRLGRRLHETIGEDGTAYRLGGDEFCVLCPAPGDTEPFVRRAVGALTEQGEVFEIAPAYGTALIPLEAVDASQALRVADGRLYAQKRAAAGTRGRPHEVVLQALFERDPELRAHVGEVAALAVAIGRLLGLDASELDDIRLAAELHDIGKLAVPDEILRKPGPLSEDDWVFIHRHTLVGQRILAVAPMLSRVGEIVRATHERWDGGGYPDRLEGEEIPLAARIIMVCDAYTAMTADRSYRRRIEPCEAIEELRRCAGTQFDPEIVPLLVAALLAQERAAAATVSRPETRRAA
jgi:diguanylate cyclase (GGDEF)-like protein